MQERIALRTQDWENIFQATENIASFLIEQRKAPLEQRINYTEIYLDPEGDLYHPVFGKVKDCIEAKNRIDELELEAVEKLSEWARGNNIGQAIWMSPSYPNKNESRFIVYELKGDEDGKKKIALHAICGKQNLEECVFIARQIIAFSKTNTNVPEPETQLDEDWLRANPIPFDPASAYSSLIDLLQDLIQPPEIWEEIRAGNHIRAKERLLSLAYEESTKFFPKVLTASSSLDYIKIGAEIEKRFQELGYKIQHIGSCGISNTLALEILEGSRVNTNSSFSLMYEVGFLERTFPCPRCNWPISAWQGITKCPICGITKEECSSCL